MCCSNEKTFSKFTSGSKEFSALCIYAVKKE